MFNTTYGMGKYQITITSTSGALKYTSSMGVSLEIIWIIDPIEPTSWSMQIVQELLYIGKWISLFIYTDPFMNVSINKILVYIQNTATQPDIYSFNNIQKYFFTNQVY